MDQSERFTIKGNKNNVIETGRCCGSGCARLIRKVRYGKEIVEEVVDIESTALPYEGDFWSNLRFAQHESLHRLVDNLVSQNKISKAEADALLKEFHERNKRYDFGDGNSADPEPEPVVDGEPINVTRELEALNKRKLVINEKAEVKR